MTVPFAVSATLGPLLIGAILNSMLYGVCAIQSFTYYRMYRRDPQWIRYFILYLFIIETINTVFDIAVVFEPLVLNFGASVALSQVPTMMKPDAIVTVLLSTPVQFFIAWRIKVVSQSTIMPAIIVFFGICSFIGGVAVFVMTVQISERMNLTVVEPALIVWLGSSAVADALITLSLSMSLYKCRTGIKATDDRITRIILFTIQTGTITTIFALADFIVFLLLPATNINFVFDFTLCKLYTNSLLSTLNSRDPQVHTGNSASVGTDAACSITQNDANLLFGRLTKRLTAVVTPGKIIRPSYIAAAGASSSDRKNTAIHEVIELDTKDHARRSQNGKSGLEVHVHKVVGSTLV